MILHKRIMLECSKGVKEFHDMLRAKQRFRMSEQDVDKVAYPIDLRFTLSGFPSEEIDDRGVPYRNYLSAGRQYSPTRVAGYSLACWNEFQKSGEARWGEAFLTQCDWLVETAVDRADALVWEYGFDWGSSLRAGWISGMAQGEALSVLRRGYLLTKDAKYADVARRAMRAMHISADEGGVQTCYRDGSICIEEYPVTSGENTHALNGSLYAMFGIYDSVAWFGERSDAELFKRCIKALASNIEEYDLGFWSAYELVSRGSNPATWTYHDLHIAQLQALHAMTGCLKFQEIALRWEGYRKCLVNRLRALSLKLKYRIRRPAPR